MAKTKSSLAVSIGVLIAGFCMGVAGTVLLAVQNDLWPSSVWPRPQHSGYELRDDLYELEPSRRVSAQVFESARELDVRRTDSLTTEAVSHPVRLVIKTINVDARIEAVGLESDQSAGRTGSSTVAVPGRTEVGWYKYGSAPGESGATVLAGHVDLGGQHGVFWDLTELASGDLIEVHLSDGSVAQYRAIRGTDFDRASLPADDLFRSRGAPALHLITCGGAFNRNLGRYESNFVLTAAPVYTNA